MAWHGLANAMQDDAFEAFLSRQGFRSLFVYALEKLCC